MLCLKSHTPGQQISGPQISQKPTTIPQKREGCGILTLRIGDTSYPLLSLPLSSNHFSLRKFLTYNKLVGGGVALSFLATQWILGMILGCENHCGLQTLQSGVVKVHTSEADTWATALTPEYPSSGPTLLNTCNFCSRC